jgi:transposase
MMDTYTQAVALKRRYRDIEEKRQIVQEALLPGASVAQVAQRHGVNANLVFNWRKLYLAGQLCDRGAAKLLPVQVRPESSPSPTVSLREAYCASVALGSIHIQLQHAQIRIEGSADVVLLRTVLELLRG